MERNRDIGKLYLLIQRCILELTIKVEVESI